MEIKTGDTADSAAMEKYRSYADEATGCQPFVPTFYSQKQLRSYASGSPIVCCILGCIAFPFKIVMLLVALVRVLALVISLLLAGLLLILIFPFKLSPYLHWFLKRLVLRLPLWIVMIAFGFNRVIEEPAGGYLPYLLALSVSVFVPALCSRPKLPVSIFQV